MEGAQDWSGAGDSYQNNEPPPLSSNYKLKKISGQKIPVFTREDLVDSNENSVEEEDALTFCSFADGDRKRRRQQQQSHHHQVKPKKSLNDILKEYLSCPICNDSCIEATSTNCGHKFCRDCLLKWRKEKPVCPICATYITSVHRLYSDDQLLETQLDDFPPHLRERYEARKKERIQELIKEASSRSLVKRVRRSLDNSLTYMRCRGSRGILSGWWSSYISNSYSGIVIGFILASLFFLICYFISAYIYMPDLQFFPYMMAAARHYNGTIPVEWTDLAKNTTVETGPQKIDGLIDSVMVWRRWW